MTNLKILLSGAGITTNTLASLLARQSQSPHAQGLNLKHNITILERAPSLRATGLQIDIRGPGVDVIRRMGLAETLRQKTVKEEGIQVVDARGRRRGWFPVSRSSNPNSTAGDATGKETGNKTAKGKTSLSTEWELMRGDLCRVLYEDVLRISSLSSRVGQGQGQGGNVEYRFNTTIQALREDADGVDVRFSNGESERFDLVVGGDGQGSRVRELLLEGNSSADQGVQVQGQNGGGGRRERRGKDPFNPLGVYAGLFTTSWPLPPSSSSSSLYPEPAPQRQSEDQLIGTAYLTAHKRAILTRRHRPDRVQIYLFARTDDPSFSALRHGHLDPCAEKALFRNHFQDAGWETPRLLDALDNAEDFYCERIGWVDMARWSSLSGLGPSSGEYGKGNGEGKGEATGGRIVLVGDAAYAPSVTTGMGTTAGIVGAYVLAGEIGRACSAISSSSTSTSTSSAESTQAKREAIQTAVGEYERTLRPFVRYIQKDLARGSNAWDRLPETRFGVGVWNVMLGVSSWLRLDEFGSWVREDRGREAWKVPVYDHGIGHGDGV